MVDAPDSLPPIFVISLARAEARRVDIQRRLDSAGVSYEIVDAVDGAALDMTQFADRLRPDKYRVKFGRQFTLGEIGCHLSHYNLWRRIADEKIETALVLEDDAVWDGDFFDVASRLPNVGWEWEVILLSAGDSRPVDRVLCDIGGGRRLARHRRRAWTTAAYVIRRSGAEKLLDYCREIRCGIDAAYSEYWKNGVAFYFADPPPARQSGAESVVASALAPPHNLAESIVGSVLRKSDRWGQTLYCWTHSPRRSDARGGFHSAESSRTK